MKEVRKGDPLLNEAARARVANAFGFETWNDFIIKVRVGKRVVISTEQLIAAGREWEALRDCYDLAQVESGSAWEVGDFHQFAPTGMAVEAPLNPLTPEHGGSGDRAPTVGRVVVRQANPEAEFEVPSPNEAVSRSTVFFVVIAALVLVYLIGRWVRGV
ncbi:MAG: hypothetical protein EPN77_19370 [Candidimonas sp.]|nr:MAG: hypothetical protein EPN77_19370 [Candidimonas sp.]